MGRKWTEEQKQALRDLWAERKHRGVPSVAPPASTASVNCSVKVSIDELGALRPAQLAAFMDGIGRVIAAQK